MPLDMSRLISGTFASEAFPVAGQGNHATDMTVQTSMSGNSIPPSTPSGTTASASSSSNARATVNQKTTLYGSAAIVIGAVVLLWLLGAIVLKVK